MADFNILTPTCDILLQRAEQEVDEALDVSSELMAYCDKLEMTIKFLKVASPEQEILDSIRHDLGDSLGNINYTDVNAVILGLEGMLSDLKKGDFKAVIVALLEKISRMFEILLDKRQTTINKLDAKIRDELSDTAEYDETKFASEIVSIYPKDKYVSIINKLINIDYTSCVIFGKTDLADAITKEAKDLLSDVGYEIAGDVIRKSDRSQIKRDSVSNLKWGVKDILSSAKQTLTLLHNSPRRARKVKNSIKAGLNAATTPEDVKLYKYNLKVLMLLVSTFEHVALQMGGQMLTIIGKLKKK